MSLGLQSLLIDRLLQVDNFRQAVDASHLFNAVRRILQDFSSEGTGSATIKVRHCLRIVPSVNYIALRC